MSDPSDGRCPLCGKPLYGWVTLPASGAAPTLGLGAAPEAGTRVIDRCESCGVGVERGRSIDLGAELAAISAPTANRSLAIECANRASLQAALGGDGWAAIDRLPGCLALTPRSLALLVERWGYRLDGVSFPPVGRGQASMWQTLTNALTFHNNFARDVRARRLRPKRGRGRWMFGTDLVVTILAAPLVALVSFPLEAIASLANRGGLMRATAEPPGR